LVLGWLGGAGAQEEPGEFTQTAHCRHRGVKFDVVLHSPSGDDLGDDMSMWVVPAGGEKEMVDLGWTNMKVYGFNEVRMGKKSACDKTVAFPISKRRVAVTLWVRGVPNNDELAVIVFDTGSKKVVSKAAGLGEIEKPLLAEPVRGGFVFENSNLGEVVVACGECDYNNTACPSVRGRVPSMIRNYLLVAWKRVVVRGEKSVAAVDPLATYRHSPLRVYFKTVGEFKKAFGYDPQIGKFARPLYIEATFEDGKRLLYDPQESYDPKKPEEKHWITPR
jgi:hypothetical protein